MPDIVRIQPEDARQKVLSGQALLVCAYPVYEKYLKYHLEGAIPLSGLHAKESKLSRDQEIIFYWNWTNENSSARLADEYKQKGFQNVKALKGGVEGWKKAGFPTL